MARGFEPSFVLSVSTFGAWSKIADGERELFLSSQWKAVKAEGDKLKNLARDTVRKAKIRRGARLATSWRGQILPAKPPPWGNRPAYLLGTNAPIPLELLETGVTITAKGAALMIPIGEAARFKQPAFTERSGRLARVIAAMKQKYGELSFHTLRNGTRALGAWVEGARGRRFVALFVLRKSVTIPKRLDTTAEVARAAQGFEDRVARRTMDAFAAGHDDVVAKAVAAAGRAA